MNQFRFFPYKPLNCPDPQVAAFDTGRRVQRLWFHLQQAWLLADGDGIIPHQLRGMSITTAAQLRWSASQRQFNLADRIAKHLPAMAFTLNVNDAIALSQKLDKSRDNMIADAFPEACYDYFCDLKEDYHPDNREGSFRDFLEREIRPRFDPLRQILCDALSASDRRILEAGMVLEEAIARSDVYRFLPPPQSGIDELGHHLDWRDFPIRKNDELEWESCIIGVKLGELDTVPKCGPSGPIETTFSSDRRPPRGSSKVRPFGAD